MNFQRSVKLPVTRQIAHIIVNTDADFEREKDSSRVTLPLLPTAIYIFFHQQWRGFSGMFEDESLQEVFAYVCGMAYRYRGLSSGCVAMPSPNAVHATRIANGGVYCEQAVWISRFVTQSMNLHANTRRVLAVGTFITVCSLAARERIRTRCESLARRKIGWLMVDSFVRST